jgi:Cupin domain
VADAPGLSYPGTGTFAAFEDPNDRFPDFGINIHVLEPGQPNAKYHAEKVQEDFLVLGGVCTLILNGEERELTQWDFVHCPAGTEHVFVGGRGRPVLDPDGGGPRPGGGSPLSRERDSRQVRSLGARVDRRLGSGLGRLGQRARAGAAAVAAGLSRAGSGIEALIRSKQPSGVV